MLDMCCNGTLYEPRLLGPSAAADVLQLTSTLSATGGQARFHFVTNDDFRLVSRAEDDIFDDLFQVQWTVLGLAIWNQEIRIKSLFEERNK